MTGFAKFFCVQLVFLFLTPVVVKSQINNDRQKGIQCGYHFLMKREPKAAPTQYLNMRLDYTDGRSAFYDQFMFERDSLRLLAFDENGKTKNQKEYQKITSLPRPRLGDVTIVDFKKNEITQCYRQATISIRGTYEMNAPAWALVDETRTIKCYSCKKATARYLGRTWIVWYTEDIPLPIGPWMLWGAPGLIVAAEDSESLFSFQLVWTDKLDRQDRIDFIDSRFSCTAYQRGATKHYVLPMKETEQMNYRLMTDFSYMSELTGVRTANGTDISARMKYIPLISRDYWKDK